MAEFTTNRIQNTPSSNIMLTGTSNPLLGYVHNEPEYNPSVLDTHPQYSGITQNNVIGQLGIKPQFKHLISKADLLYAQSRLFGSSIIGFKGPKQVRADIQNNLVNKINTTTGEHYTREELFNFGGKTRRRRGNKKRKRKSKRR